MIRLRLFHKDDLTNQIDSRTLDDGELTIGRDAHAGWAVSDPERGISRTHLTVASRGGLMTVRDTSANGVFLGDPRQRLERDRPVPIGPGETLRFGNFVLVVEDVGASSPASPAPAPAAGGFDPSPFGAPAGFDAPRAEPGARRLDPFASAIRPDPLIGGPDAPTEAQVEVDAWERRPDRNADGWNAVPAHRRADPPAIGADRDWIAPPPEPAGSGYGFDAPFSSPILHAPAIPADAAEIPSDWALTSLAAATDPVSPPAPPAPTPAPAATPVALTTPAPGPPARPAPAPATSDESALFDAFCAGAGLSPCAFANEDRVAMMERLGTIYRQTILGLADVMGERTALKNEYRMSRTTVRPEGNNPFKWVPPQRIAIDLLRAEDSGYVTGAPALNEAFHDVKAHLLCMLAGMRAALGATFDALAPAAIEQRLAGRSYLIRAQRDAAAWTDYTDRFAEIRREADDSSEGIINAAFRTAYERQLEEIRGYGAGR